jgi:hypothetical protein
MIEVKPMKKVTVSVSLVHKDRSNDPEQGEISCSFIHGIGRDGLTPFECLLEGCRKGDQVQTEVKSTSLAEYFGGLLRHLQPLIEGKILSLDLLFRIDIQSVEDVENREMVAALAGSAGGCGSGGSCGCGCS